jgi:hypothetical protein
LLKFKACTVTGMLTTLLRLHIFSMAIVRRIYVRRLDDPEQIFLVLSRILVIVEGVWIGEVQVIITP